jgi:HlyD family secretion protein
VHYVERSAFTKISALGVEEQRVNVIIDIASANEKWRAVGDGFRVEARIVIDQRDAALTVPVSALFHVGERWMVFTVSAGRAHERTVAVGPRNALTAVVETGLSEGESVIIYPGSSVRDGVRVAVR